MRVAKDEPYMGEGIPLRWLKFERAKAARKEGMLKISRVYFIDINYELLQSYHYITTHTVLSYVLFKINALNMSMSDIIL